MSQSASKRFGPRREIMENADEHITSRFQAWLGHEIFSAEHSARYVALYRKFSGPLQGGSEPTSEIHWNTFIATVDAWAAGQLSAFASRNVSLTAVLLPLPEGRDSFTGLRRGRRTPPVSVNTAREDALRQVPGIGASSARKIVADRASHGPFDTLEQIVERRCMSMQALALGRRYLTVSRAPELDKSTVTPDFAAYVRLRQALKRPRSGLDLAQAGMVALESAVNSGGATSYWKGARIPADPLGLVFEEGRARHENLMNSRENLLAAPLDSSGYVKLLKRIIPKAISSIRIQTPSLGILHVEALRPLLAMLAGAVERKLDVRILYDERYAPSATESDDVAYLRARNVPCRAYPLAVRMHSRTIVIDHEHVICGSHSWSPTSIYHSEELSFYVRSSRLAGQQIERFDTLWRAAEPDQRFVLDFFRLWSDETHENLRNAGIGDSRQLCSLGELKGWTKEELQLLQREVRLVTDNRLPLSVARCLAKAGVADVSAMADVDTRKVNIVLGGPASTIEGSDLAPLGAYLDRYFSARKHDR
jgi:hypothetical protein